MAISTYPCPKCGAKIDVVGRNRADADRRCKREAAEGRVCYDCFKAEQAEERAAKSAAAAQIAVADHLPSLEGTPKQIAFAETVRRESLDGFPAASDVLVEHLRARGLPDDQFAAAHGELLDAIALIKSEWSADGSAKFWLDTLAYETYPTKLAAKIAKALLSRRETMPYCDSIGLLGR